MSIRWMRTKDERPPPGVLLTVITGTGLETNLIYSNNLWWLPDRSMYVYYQPVLWRVAEEPR